MPRTCAPHTAITPSRAAMCTRQLARCPSLVMETRGMATRSTSSAQCGAMRQQALQVWRQAQLCGVIQHGKSCHVHHMTYGKASSPHRVLHTVTHTTHASFPPHCPCIPCHHPLNLTPPGILIEDQLWPKSCGHVRGKRVAPRDEALARIRAFLLYISPSPRDEGDACIPFSA